MALQLYKTFFLLVFLLSYSLNISAQDKFKYLTEKGKNYDLQSQNFGSKKLYDRAIQYAKKAVAAYSEARDYNRLGDAFTRLAGYCNFDVDSELAQKIIYLQAALRAYSRNGNQIKVGDTYQKLGNMYCVSSNQLLAIENLKKGLAVFQAINYPKLQGLYHFLNESYVETGDFTQGLKYGLEALKVAESVGDSTVMLSAIYNHIAKAYRGMGNAAKAEMYYSYALKYAQHTPDTLNNTLPDYNKIALNLSGVYVTEHKERLAIANLQTVRPSNVKQAADLYSVFIRAYVQSRDFEMAGLYFNKLVNVLKGIEKISYVYEIANSSIVLYLFETKRYDEARASITDFENIPNYPITNTKLALDQHWLFRIDSARGDYLSAIRHSQLERIMQDSILNIEKNKSITRLEVQYETEKKEREIKLKTQSILLLTKQSELQKASLQKAALLRNVIIGGITMLALLLALGYNRYQIKQKNNIQLEFQQVEINDKNIALERLVVDKDELLKEKEWLLKEIHHRVKNNLQIVISLLNTQSIYLNNGEALAAIRESQHRMQSISLIHQKLYQSDNLARIDMDEYICELVEYLQESFDTVKRIEIIMEIEPVCLDVVKAVPIGLILNEAITNAIKYAFPAGGEGRIIISLDEPVAGTLALTISDNGAGLPADFDLKNCTSLGMSLMRGLSRQLRGEFKFFGKDGLTIQIVIPQYMVLYDEPASEGDEYATLTGNN